MTPEKKAQRENSQKVVNLVTAKHPMPWDYQSIGSDVYMTDALGVQIQLFDMLDFCKHYSKVIALNIEESSSNAQAAAQAG